MEIVIQKVERHKSSFLLSLQVDQTSLIVNVAEKTNRINHDMDLEKLKGAMEAGFESFSDRNEDQCLQGTRTELLRQIMEWALSPSSKTIFWLKGMAGTGKSTISRTVSRSLKDTNHLGASFFFKRGEGDRGNAKKFFPTLTRQLILGISELRPGVYKALRDDPDIASKSLTEQFDKLLLQPLLDLHQSSQQSQATVVVIDALDECENDQDIRNIIRLLPLLQKAKGVRLRIFLTSRPELPISLGFSDIKNGDYQDVSLHEMPEEVIGSDISLFIRDRFAQIKHSRNIYEDWPDHDVIQQLVTMSVPLFISAATVCRYIENSKWEPKSRLAELLIDQTKYVSRMDKTYLPILTQLLDDQDSDESEQRQLLLEFQKIVGAIILLASPLSINALSLFLDMGADQISNRLQTFQSVLNIPSDRDDPVRILHLSFRDFLVQSKTKFFVEERCGHKDIAGYCFRAMSNGLQKDICHLTSPGAHRADIDPQHIQKCIPPVLQYSCRFWTYHFEQSQALPSDTEHVLAFLQVHLLHWMEAMSLIGLISEVVVMLDRLHALIPVDDNSPVSDFLHDAKRFVLRNHQIADKAPLQIYFAGLVFAPREAITRKIFESELPDWICQYPHVNESWSANLQTLEGHTGSVKAVAFSRDGRLLASGSFDHMVHLWDTTTGALRQTLGGHTRSVNSVAFSKDGRLLASGSDDETVRLWDTATGALQHRLDSSTGPLETVAFLGDECLLASRAGEIQQWDTTTGALRQTLQEHNRRARNVAFFCDGLLQAFSFHDEPMQLWDMASGTILHNLKGHTDWVESMAFSHDGRLLASGSSDETVRLWVTATGTLQWVLEGHSSAVESVAFSSNGRLLASGSSDRTVRIWDTSTGTLQQVLKGAKELVESLALSHDGRLLASGSLDRTVRLWDMALDATQQNSNSHADWVKTMAFSHDGQVLATGSGDPTVRLWDAITGHLQQTLVGHKSWINSVTFSYNDQLLASGSWDNTVRLWDRASGALQQTFEGHSSGVEVVVFSRDGRLLASGSYRTVCLWDTATGALQQTFEAHSSGVEVVKFSRDGRLLASAGDDHDPTVRLWDTATGVLQQVFDGHTGSVVEVIFSHDGRLLASASRFHDDMVRLWDTATGGLQHTFDGHISSVTKLAFSRDSRLLASANGVPDNTVRLWDSATGAPRETFSIKGEITELGFSRDGLCLVTNLGILDIQAWCGNYEPHLPDTTPVIGMTLDEDWILVNGEQVLWLPYDIRPDSFVVKENRIALGLRSGQVFILGFHG